MKFKICNKCSLKKPEVDFLYRERSGGYYTQPCKNCNRLRAAALRHAAPRKCIKCDPTSTVTSSYCRGCAVLKSHQWRLDNPEKYRAHGKKAVCLAHGITVEEKQNCLRDQKNACALCFCLLTIDKARIDHSHECGNQKNHSKDKTQRNRFGCPQCIRGLLCDGCNWGGLPFLERNPHLQSELVKKYLQQRPFNGANLSR